MNGDNFPMVNKEFKGLVLLVLGVILLLYTLNILQLWLNGFFIFLAIALIFYGSYESGILQRLWAMIGKKK